MPWVPKYARNALVKMPVLRSWSSALLASAAERIEATGAPQALRRTFSSSSLQKGILPHRADADAPRVAALCTGALSLSPWCTCTYVAQRAPWTRTPVERSARGRSGTTRRPARHSCGGTRRGCARTASKSWSTRARCLGRTCALRPRSQASTGFEDTPPRQLKQQQATSARTRTTFAQCSPRQAPCSTSPASRCGTRHSRGSPCTLPPVPSAVRARTYVRRWATRPLLSPATEFPRMPFLQGPLKCCCARSSRPEGLVAGAGLSARDAGVHFAGENALFCWSDEGAIEQIEVRSAPELCRSAPEPREEGTARRMPHAHSAIYATV